MSAALLAALAAGGLLVLPPEPPAEGSREPWIAETVSALLPEALGWLGVPAASRADRLGAHEALELPPTTLTRATSIRIAGALQVDRIVVGRYETEAGGGLRLALRVLDVERGSLSAPFAASGREDELAGLVDALAWDLALSLSARPAKSRDGLLARRAAPKGEALRAFGQALVAADPAARARLLRRALAFSPQLDEARVALGRQQLQTRDLEGALQTLAGVALEPLAREAAFLRGRAFLDLGRYRDAARVYATLVAARPSAATLNNHALALLRQPAGAFRASEVLQRARELEPADRDVSFNLGFALLFEGDPSAAVFWLSSLVKQSPRDVHARLVLAWALRAAGREAEAAEAWKAIGTLSPELRSLEQPELGRRFERVASSERRLVFGDGARSDSELAAARVGRAERELEAGELEAARRELEQAAYLDPYNARVHLLLARASRGRGDAEAAASALRVSLWCRDDPAVRAELAETLLGLGRRDEARVEAKRALAADPQSAAARRVLEAKER
ncbi:MAG: tetratricopeptide repeat protein [Vicinamibacteria bacterium]